MKDKLEVIDEYFENGIRIKVLKGFTGIKPKTKSNCNSPIRDTKHASSFYNNKLREWCESKQGRMKALVENSPMSLSWYQKRRYGSLLLSEYDFKKIIQPAMAKVEHDEQLALITKKHCREKSQ